MIAKSSSLIPLPLVGISFEVQSVETVVASMAEKVTALGRHSNSQRITNRPTLSVLYGLNNFMKGTSPCKKNFSGHPY